MREVSQPGEARRVAADLARRIGFDEIGQSRAGLLATEMGRNLVLHSSRGELFLRELTGSPGVEFLAVDHGPGMASVTDCLRDGFSTAGTAGMGLGAIRRTASQWDISSTPGVGTVLLARLFAEGGHPDPLVSGVVSAPYPGEEHCGDSCSLHVEAADRALLLVVDGLGHGAGAAEAARVAVAHFQREVRLSPADILRRLDGGLRATRGAAVAVAEIGRDAVRFAGVGNIAGTILHGERQHTLVSHNGILGHQVRKVQEFTYPWSPGSLLIMHSDGLATSWRLDRYPGLAGRDPAVIAGVLYRDHTRGRDDVTVAALRREEV